MNIEQFNKLKNTNIYGGVFFVYRYEKYKWRFLQSIGRFIHGMRNSLHKDSKSHFVKDANLFCRKHQLRLTLKGLYLCNINEQE